MKRELVKQYYNDGGDLVKVYKVPVTDTIWVNTYTKEYKCMITYNGRDSHIAWLTGEQQTAYIRSSNNYDYYNLGESRDTICGGYYNTVIIRHDLIEEIKPYAEIVAEIEQFFIDNPFCDEEGNILCPDIDITKLV